MTDHAKIARDHSEVRNLADAFVSSLKEGETVTAETVQKGHDLVQAMKAFEKTQMDAHEESHKPSKKEEKAHDTPSRVDEPEAIAVLNTEGQRSPSFVTEKAEKPGGQDANNASSFVSNPGLGEAHKEAKEAIHLTPATPAKLGDENPQANQTEDGMKPDVDEKALPLAKKAAEKGAEDSKGPGEAIQASEKAAKGDVKKEGDKKPVGKDGKTL